MPLSSAEREAFLAEPHIGALAVIRGASGRAPLNVPVWYGYEPGGELWILTGRDSAKARAIASAGLVSLMVQRLEPTIRYVTVEGPVTSIDPGTQEDLQTISERYLPPEAVAGYVRVAAAEHGPQVVVRFRPEHWLSADLGRVG